MTNDFHSVFSADRVHRFARRAPGSPFADGDRQLLIVSNRQPYRHEYTVVEDEGCITTVDRPIGGVTAGLDPLLQQVDGTWIAWGDGGADPDVVGPDGCVRVPPSNPAYTLRRLWLTDEEVTEYYYGYSNQVLWPLCHRMLEKVHATDQFWRQYRAVNAKFARTVVEQAGTRPLVWFQDYHLALAPRRVRRRLSSDALLMHFWHIPWPSWETFCACSHRKELLIGLLGNDLLGFHTERYCANFLDCIAAGLDEASIDWEGRCVVYDGQSTAVRAFPMGIDTTRIRHSGETTGATFWREFRRNHGIEDDRKIALGVERLDYTKGILERLAALERLWETHPEWREELTYIQKATESRSQIDEYRTLHTDVVKAIHRINDRFGTDDWQPVVYSSGKLPQEDLYGLYRYSDVMLVSALCDGMNLVAKEYVAAQVENDGVLVLSELTGAHEELGNDALTINPYNTSEFAEIINDALALSDCDRCERMSQLRQQVNSNSLYNWMNDMFEAVRLLRQPYDDPAPNIHH